MRGNMPTKTEIFKDMQDILRKDYSGHIDKAEINCREKYRITDDMSDEEFKSTIQSYLLDFKDGHLWFTSKNKTPLSIGFQVRKFQDALYVIKADEEKRIEAGDRVILIDGLTISQMAKRYSKE
ncbi:hypothetical protein [Salinicoccus sp. YB14-2]|uniref:hypothetical protein n=1 Tax=Salinicoccus sp. YB14-2 TaxID=1572701 RepID=UPI00068F282F|nr:hypothetical protein [Salinicoccus sp. YB14-2]